MSNAKTFRLFISSTFNDFRREREVLQTKVFPHIKEYASDKGYTFQPIDLRWGVSNEAQLDQKTLELCLSEVRTCKSHMHPNFLIMMGDRYGWIPLPYAIEVEEFELLLALIDKEDREALLTWYKKDLNQLPASYILKERKEEYEDFDKWGVVENNLRDILQSAVDSSDLNEEEKRKYFLSATEAEVNEGIISYIKPTKYQKDTLLSKDPSLYIVDPKHVFGFFRDIDKTTQIDNKFITDDYEEAKVFKKRVDTVLLGINKLHINTKQRSKENLEEGYLQEFATRMTTFLKVQVDIQKAAEEKEERTSLEIEKQAQKKFSHTKRKDFLETDNLKAILNDIKSYRSDSTQRQPLVIYGASGRGKSSLIAKAIQEADNAQQEKVIYRFVGATPHSSSSKEILTSLFTELGKDIKYKQESFEQFSEHIYNEIMNIAEEVTIFIDAVDQLDHDDQFLWLPSSLPKNVKIIISALKDDNYKEDSKYLLTLQGKTNNTHEIPTFNAPLELLTQLLKTENRTLQENQKTYFLKQFKTANSPLYISVAVQELKHWKSYDVVEGETLLGDREVQDLQTTNRGIIKEFITNLSKLFHHNEKFVYKVLGFIYGSRDGLSESELLQLISSDNMFVEEITPDTFHKNLTKELPLVHWSRLHVQLKVFLSQNSQDNEELMYFFHREFEDVIKTLPKQQYEHEAIIKATQELIKQNQDKAFDNNRWGKLYATLITEYELRYKNKQKQKEFAKFILRLDYDGWVDACLENLDRIGHEHYQHNRMYKAMAYQESYLHSKKALYQNNPSRAPKDYIRALNNLATSYKYQNRQDEAISLEEESLMISKVLYQENTAIWAKDYTRTLINLARSYYNQNRIDDGIGLLEEALEIRKIRYQENPVYWAGYYTIALNDLAYSYKEQDRIEEAIVLEEEALKIRKKLYETNPFRWPKDYTRSLNNLATSYKNQNRLEEAMILEEESYKISQALYRDNPSRWAKDFTIALNNLAISYYHKYRLAEAVALGEESLEISKRLYQGDAARWVEFYTRALNDLAHFYTYQNRIDEAIALEEESYKISRVLYNNDAARWAKDYTRSLNNLAATYYKQNRLEEAIALQEESLKISKVFYLDDSTRWAGDYARTLKGLATFYKNQNSIDEAITLQKKSLTIIEGLYTRNPARWAEDYAMALNDMEEEV